MLRAAALPSCAARAEPNLEPAGIRPPALHGTRGGLYGAVPPSPPSLTFGLCGRGESECRSTLGGGGRGGWWQRDDRGTDVVRGIWTSGSILRCHCRQGRRLRSHRRQCAQALRELGILNWVRPCAERWQDGQTNTCGTCARWIAPVRLAHRPVTPRTSRGIVRPSVPSIHQRRVKQTICGLRGCDQSPIIPISHSVACDATSLRRACVVWNGSWSGLVTMPPGICLNGLSASSGGARNTVT
jgi:hypothetical protein